MAGLECSRRVRPMALIAFLFAFFTTGSSTAQVPLLMWSNDGLPQLASPAAGHITSREQLSAYLSSALGSGPHTVLLLLQDKLSKDDFTVFGGVFGNKQDSAFQNLEAALHSSSSSLVLPALAWPESSALPALLQEQLGVSPLLVDLDTLSQLNLSASVSNLLLINLPSHTGSYESRKEVLHRNDEMIGEVMSIMKAKNVPYTAIYTGLQPSRVISEMSMSSQPVGRTLLQNVDVKPPIMFNANNTPCIMLWAQSLNVSFTGGSQWTDFALQTPSLTGSQCNGSSSLLVLTYPNATLSFAMSRQFYSVSARNWFTLDSVQLQFSGQTASFIGSRGIYAPAEYSFHCESVSSFRDALLVPNNTNQNTSQWMVNFVDFQIQGFGVSNGNFSYASDCAGFFSPGIWMGLLTSLLMLLILVYGLHMIMQLNTMDRFDDPKGPSISVPQSE
ncbi:V-type proton ATPase subunit S1b [Myripristis murdjan]|uniref:ATPase H+ transporting accessory protein 1b n=1 Tax=Myripristis murdjan TaxID=586833 RepID=A0A667YEX8_9TELE|nr:V-type proton ATPase subunit S1-like [Myripristis murdjan]XP_029910833.1 V-type proton ATPase subunit S1-like [Myripristis murdjan]